VKRAATLFGSNPVAENVLALLGGSQLATYADDDALTKVVVGRSDIDIAAMVNMLGISDWVHEGQAHFDKCKPKCPFCQQDAPADLEAKLNAYFDSSYTDACAAIDKLIVGYGAESKRIKEVVGVLVSNPSPRIDLDLLRAHQRTLTALLDGNTIKLREKREEPSTIATLDSVDTAIADINGMVAAVNVQIKAHNLMVANLSKDRVTLTTAVWRHLWDVALKTELSTFNAKRDGLEKAIAGLNKQITDKKNALTVAEGELKELEKKTTSVAPTMKAMAELLKSFSFTTFTLREGGTVGTYELVRSNGQSAKETLSDGEKTFLTFIYFYHLVKGSQDATGTTTKRVIVVDDPVSSLDSDVLFVVSSLLKNLFADARNDANQIAQVFALTHNIYFHKEITFDSKRKGETPRTDESFWVVRRTGTQSQVERCAMNPVKSSYELLWADVRNPNPPQSTICNTLRRIVENYFKLLGGIDPHTLHEKFDGEEKTICRSLVSWINDGSHFGMEDLHLSQSPEAVKKYLDVFRQVFETQNHEGHYRMMMGEAFTERPAPANPHA
jgi:wobble nucleotide-excising tRNase